jgi:hypothetical protein
VQTLAPVPSIAKIAAIAKEENAGKRVGAARVRGAFEEIYPDEDTCVLSDQAQFLFKPFEKNMDYSMKIQDSEDNQVFSLITRTNRIEIPPGLLQDGSQYSWTIEAISKDRVVTMEASFCTVSSENAQARHALAQQAKEFNSPDLYLLLMKVDLNLGLYREACEEMEVLLQQIPENQELKDLLPSLKCTDRTK